VEIVCQPTRQPFCAILSPEAERVAEQLELDRYLVRLIMCLDDLAADERVWLSFTRVPLPAGGTGHSLTLYLHPDHLQLDRPAAMTLLPAASVWEHKPEQRDRADTATLKPSLPKIERFLYHQFLSIRDLCDGSITPADIPAESVEAFQELWAVTVDGRLRHQMRPGYSAAERRRRFSRVFSTAVIILPEHWEVFHELWAMPSVDQARLMAQLAGNDHALQVPT